MLHVKHTQDLVPHLDRNRYLGLCIRQQWVRQPVFPIHNVGGQHGLSRFRGRPRQSSAHRDTVALLFHNPARLAIASSELELVLSWLKLVHVCVIEPKPLLDQCHHTLEQIIQFERRGNRLRDLGGGAHLGSTLLEHVRRLSLLRLAKDEIRGSKGGLLQDGYEEWDIVLKWHSPLAL